MDTLNSSKNRLRGIRKRHQPSSLRTLLIAPVQLHNALHERAFDEGLGATQNLIHMHAWRAAIGRLLLGPAAAGRLHQLHNLLAPLQDVGNHSMHPVARDRLACLHRRPKISTEFY